MAIQWKNEPKAVQNHSKPTKEKTTIGKSHGDISLMKIVIFVAWWWWWRSTDE